MTTETKTLPPLLREESYPYPDTVYEYFDETVRLDTLHRGDQIELDGEICVVAQRKTGTKWTELFRKDGTKILRQQNETMVTVTRRRETQESHEAWIRAEKNRKIRNDVLPHFGRDDQHRVSSIKDVFTDISQNKLAKGWLLQSSDIEKIFTENAEAQVRAKWISLVEWSASGRRENWSGDLVDLMIEFTDKLKDELADKYRQRSLSRSSNMVQNLMDDVENEVMAKFIYNVKWYV